MRNHLIFDLGMHKGEDSEFYLKKGFRVVAVEADPELAASATERLARYVMAGQLKVVNRAIAPRAGPITFYACETASIWGTIDKGWADRRARLGARVHEMTVDGIQFPGLLQDYGVPHYLKIDIEGADVFCLESLLEQPERPSFISLESAKTSLADVNAEFSLLERLGYKKFKIIPQHRITEQTLPFPAREGAYVEHKFRAGCSGAFGLELPGEWLSRDQAIKQYRAIHRLYRLTGEGGVLTSASIIRSALNKSRIEPNSLTGALVRKLVKPIGARLGLVTGWYDTHATLAD
jgi:FkbM family methyltransferase